MGHDIREILEKAGAFSRTENLKAILGDLSTTKRLGQMLGALTETNTLYAILGAADAVANPIATDTKYLYSVAIGVAPTGFSISDVLKVSGTEKLKDFIAKTGGTEIPATESIYDSIKHIVNTAVTGAGIADSIVDKLDLGAGNKPASDQYYTTTRGPYLDILNTDSKYILTNAIPAPTVNSLARFIVSGGTALGTVLADSKSIIDAIGHSGGAILAGGLGANIGNFQGQVNLTSLLGVLGSGWDTANRDIYTSIEGPTGIFHEQADVKVSIAVDNIGVDILDYNVANTRYIIRDMRLKLASDPGANTVTISLETLINDVPTVVDTFVIDTANWGTYHTLMDMFGVPHIAGDDIHIFATYSVAGPITLTGQYSYAKTNV